jgi:dipeptidyl aminopeptidase/acylaminoacyl peptidase
VQIPVPTDAQHRPVTSMDLLAIRDLHGLSISPDGKYVAFVAGQAVHETNSYRSAIFVVGTAPGSILVCLGSAGLPEWDDINQWVDEAAQWSPDARYIMRRMRLRSDETWQVWRWSREGGPPVQLTHSSGDVESYTLAPDGTKLLLNLKPPRDPLEADRLAQTGILYDGSFLFPRNRSVISEVLAMKPNPTETWVHQMTGGDERQATREEIAQLGPWVSDLDEKILNSLSGGSIEGHHIVDAKISPDRRLVAYRYLPKNYAEARGRVYLLFVKPVQGGNPVALPLPADAWLVIDYWWGPDSNSVYYLQADADGRPPKFMVIDAAGGPARQAYAGRDYVSSCSIDQSAHFMACGREGPTTPKQIAVLDLARGNMRELVDLNPEFRNLTLSPPVRIEGINRYGDKWFAHLVKPLNYEPGKRYPTILTTYRSGDYFLRGASGDVNPVQVYAAHGFAVLSFDMGRDRYVQIKEGDFHDFLIAVSSPVASMEMAIRKGVEVGIVDPERVGVSGYSRGTEQVAYAISQTKLFRAASGATASTSPCLYYMSPDYVRRILAAYGLGGWPDGVARSRWMMFAAPLNADRIQTPLLNNDPDSEVLFDLPLYTALRELKKPVELFIYPNELHHINQPKHRYQVYERNLDWFRFWLKSEQDQEPGKEEQYKRWYVLRKLQERD